MNISLCCCDLLGDKVRVVFCRMARYGDYPYTYFGAFAAPPYNVIPEAQCNDVASLTSTFHVLQRIEYEATTSPPQSAFTVIFEARITTEYNRFTGIGTVTEYTTSSPSAAQLIQSRTSIPDLMQSSCVFLGYESRSFSGSGSTFTEERVVRYQNSDALARAYTTATHTFANNNTTEMTQTLANEMIAGILFEEIDAGTASHYTNAIAIPDSSGGVVKVLFATSVPDSPPPYVFYDPNAFQPFETEFFSFPQWVSDLWPIAGGRCWNSFDVDITQPDVLQSSVLRARQTREVFAAKMWVSGFSGQDLWARVYRSNPNALVEKLEVGLIANTLPVVIGGSEIPGGSEFATMASGRVLSGSNLDESKLFVIISTIPYGGIEGDSEFQLRPPGQ